MAQKKPTDEDLMSLADDALDTKRRAEILAMVESDAALKSRVEAFRHSRSLLGSTLKPLADKELPAELREAVERMAGARAAHRSAEVVPFKQKVGLSALRDFRPSAIAASVAAVLAGLAGYLIGVSVPGSVESHMLIAGSSVSQALGAPLGSAVSGAESKLGADRLHLISSVYAGDGALCREFEVDYAATRQTVAAVACRRNGDWRIEAVVTAPAGADGYAPASSLTVMDSYLQAIGSGEALTPEMEAIALKPTNGPT